MPRTQKAAIGLGETAAEPTSPACKARREVAAIAAVEAAEDESVVAPADVAARTHKYMDLAANSPCGYAAVDG